MKKSVTTLAAALLVGACQKADDRLHVSYRVECRSCAVEVVMNDQWTVRDTIIGLIEWRYVNGEPVPDTLPGASQWNATVRTGGRFYASACPLAQWPASVSSSAGHSAHSVGLECAIVDAIR